MNKIEINQAVHQPPMDKQIGGRSLPELKQTPKKSNIGRNITLITVAAATAGVGYVILNQGEGTNNPQPTKVPGGIVEQSPTPSFKPSEVIASATPGATLEVTFPPTPEPIKTAEPTPELKTLKQIISEAPKDPVKLGTFIDSANKAIETDNKYLLTQYPGIQSLIDDCKDPNLSSANQVPACRVATLDFLKQAQATGKQEYYVAGSNGLYYIKVKFPNRYSEIITEFQTILK